MEVNATLLDRPVPRLTLWGPTRADADGRVHNDHGARPPAADGSGDGARTGRCLVVGDECLDEPGVVERLRVGRSSGVRFHVLVPAFRSADTRRLVTSAGDPLSGLPLGDLSGLEAAMARDRERAVERAAAVAARFRDAGLGVTTEVGGSDPTRAVLATLRRFAADEIVVVVRPSLVARWLRLDVVHRLRASSPVPVVALARVNAARRPGRW